MTAGLDRSSLSCSVPAVSFLSCWFSQWPRWCRSYHGGGQATSARAGATAGSFPVSYWVPLLDTQVFAFESFLAPRPGRICHLSSQRGNLHVLCLQHDAPPDDSCPISGPAARGVQLGQVRGTGLLCSAMHWHPLMTQLCISVNALVAGWLACLSHCAGTGWCPVHRLLWGSTTRRVPPSALLSSRSSAAAPWA